MRGGFEDSAASRNRLETLKVTNDIEIHSQIQSESGKLSEIAHSAHSQFTAQPFVKLLPVPQVPPGSRYQNW